MWGSVLGCGGRRRKIWNEVCGDIGVWGKVRGSVLGCEEMRGRYGGVFENVGRGV